MVRSTTKKVAFISSFPPRRCGIATFTSDLVNSLKSCGKGQFEPLVVAIRQDNDLKYAVPVRFEIRQDVKSDYICAADYVNFNHIDLVSVQHEFGLFGGEGGSYLSLLLNRLNVPVITTLHTILDDPAPAHYKSMIDVCIASYKVITMNEHGVSMLRDIYGVSEKNIELIPHGIPDLSFVDSNYYKHKFGMEGRKTILTFGLLNPNKGIEIMLKALPTVVKAEPSVLYIVLGMTHPSVLKYDGESYRFSLQQMVKEMGLQKHVIFHNRFVSDEELRNFLCAADLYVTPYLNMKQPTSGTLSFAVGSGKAVISTPYWAAMELLAKGRGRLVGFGDWKQLAEEVVGVLRDDSLYYSLRRKAYDYGRSRTWPKIGRIYWKLFTAKGVSVRVAAKAIPSKAETLASIEVPEPSLEHLQKLTDATGLYQHAIFTIPDRKCGYSTDDNARAVIAMTRYYVQYPEPQALRLFETYLSFVLHSQDADGSVRNFMNFDRTWVEQEPENDAFGRVLWAMGTVMAKPPLPSYMSVAKECFDRSVELVEKQYARSMAYSILGMSDYLKQFPGVSDIKRHLAVAADKLMTLYEKNSDPAWQWFENRLTYDNAVLPHALFVAGLTFEDEKYLDAAKKTCEFLLQNTFTGSHFSFVGSNGWFKRGQTKAQFDQQPIEAAGTVMMLKAAYDATGDLRFIKLQRKAFDWFLGENDLRIPLYDFRTKGCCDGLGSGGVNMNQGAESVLSFLVSLLAVIENYAILDEVARTAEVSPESTFLSEKGTVQQATERPAPIENTPVKTESKKNQVEELA